MLGTAGLDHGGKCTGGRYGALHDPQHHSVIPHGTTRLAKEAPEYTVKLGCLSKFLPYGGLFDDTTLFTDGLTVSVLSTV